MLRDNSSEVDASARLNSQLPIATKVKYADIVIDNSDTKAKLGQQTVAFIEDVNKSTGGARWLFNWLVPPAGVISAVWTLLSRNLFSSHVKRE